MMRTMGEGEEKPSKGFLLREASAATPRNGMLSRALLDDAVTRVTLIGLAAGERRAEHSSRFPALLLLQGGSCEMHLAGDRVELRQGSLMRLRAGLPYALLAREKSSLLLILLKVDEERWVP